jgi:hypothetical protein
MWQNIVLSFGADNIGRRQDSHCPNSFQVPVYIEGIFAWNEFIMFNQQSILFAPSKVVTGLCSVLHKAFFKGGPTLCAVLKTLGAHYCILSPF